MSDPNSLQAWETMERQGRENEGMCSQLASWAERNPISAVAAAVGVGLGLGAVVACSVGYRRRQATSHHFAYDFGRKLQSSLDHYLPEAVARALK